MTATDVRQVLAALDGLGPVLSGGWGVDALWGVPSRDHRDLDLGLDGRHLDAAIERLSGLGFAVGTDWRPVRIELSSADGRHVDLHPLVIDEAGDGRQAGLAGSHFDWPAADRAVGWVDGCPVACISVRQQREFHAGYPPRPVDGHDLALLDLVERSTVSGLFVLAPATEPLVGGLRDRYDASTADGMPAHVTVFFPFEAPTRLDETVLGRLAGIVGRHAPFDLTFARPGWFGAELLYLEPVDPAPLLALSDALVTEFPAWPLYEGAYDDVVPHLTVAYGQPIEVLAAAAETLEAGLPVTQHVTELALVIGGDGVPLRTVQAMPLGVQG